MIPFEEPPRVCVAHNVNSVFHGGHMACVSCERVDPIEEETLGELRETAHALAWALNEAAMPSLAAKLDELMGCVYALLDGSD